MTDVCGVVRSSSPQINIGKHDQLNANKDVKQLVEVGGNTSAPVCSVQHAQTQQSSPRSVR